MLNDYWHYHHFRFDKNAYVQNKAGLWVFSPEIATADLRDELCKPELPYWYKERVRSWDLEVECFVVQD